MSFLLCLLIAVERKMWKEVKRKKERNLFALFCCTNVILSVISTVKINKSDTRNKSNALIQLKTSTLAPTMFQSSHCNWSSFHEKLTSKWINFTNAFSASVLLKIWLNWHLCDMSTINLIDTHAHTGTLALTPSISALNKYGNHGMHRKQSYLMDWKHENWKWKIELTNMRRKLMQSISCEMLYSQQCNRYSVRN